MINEYNAKKFCKEDISKIENYEKAINDTKQMWHCHHREEIKVLPSGIKVISSRKELKDNGRYYNCPANELIFLTKSEHRRLHNFNRSESTKIKMSEAMKGRVLSIESRKKMSESLKDRDAWNKGKKGIYSEDTIRKMSESKKGKSSWNKGKATSVFGKAFIEHYGITCSDNEKLYSDEYKYFKRHGKFSWK